MRRNPRKRRPPPPDTMRPQGFGMPSVSMVLRNAPWQPHARIVQEDLQGGLFDGELQVVDSDSLQSDWPVLPTEYRTNLALEADNESAWRIPLSLYDQGLATTGLKHSMGVGIKVTAPRAGPAELGTVVPDGTKVLSFAIVARLTGEMDPLAAVGRVVDVCRERSVGGERGYGVLTFGSTLLLFDAARSPGWYVNSATGAHKWLRGRKPKVNLRLSICNEEPHLWTAWYKAKGKLKLGTPLFAPYGTGSTHHAEIREIIAKRAEREPACGARKRKNSEQLVQARKKRLTAGTDSSVPSRQRIKRSLAREVTALASL